ncbi:MAG TPA: DUF4126 domain-containing protein [Capillimicrobium sp.]|nr:DUF4126 domain-containing protein [Capillimicrobium sp.]
MRLLIAILTGLGLSASAGLRPFLPALLTGALAGADAEFDVAGGHVGVDFDGTDFAFLESGVFLLIVLVLLVGAIVAQRRFGIAAVEGGPLGAALSGIAIAFGAVLFAGALDEDGYAWWPGLIAGGAIAALGQAAVRSLFGRIRARADRAVSEALVAYQDGGSLIGAAVAIFVPPLSLVVVALLGWLYVGGRRRQGEKYAGLRILR